MPFWIVVLKVIKVIMQIKKYANILNNLREGNLVKAFVSSWVCNSVFDSLDELIGHDVFKTISNPIGIVEQNINNKIKEHTNFLNSPFFQTYTSFQQKINDIENAIKEKVKEKFDDFVIGDSIIKSKEPILNLEKAGDPIELATGTFVKKNMDFNIDGAGINLIFNRVYRSTTRYIGPFGYNWDHSYNIRLIQNDEFTYTLLAGELTQVVFVRHPRYGESLSYNYYSPNGAFGSALVVTESECTIIFPEGKRYLFKQREDSLSEKSRYFIDRIEDRFGNYLKFTYKNKSLEKIEINAPGRYIMFSYDAMERIESIVDHTKRKIEYKYNDFGFLSSYKGPYLSTSKNVKSEYYEYILIGNDYKLKTVFDWKGRIITENEYNADTLSNDFGKVIKQIENDGETFYDYEKVLTNDALNREYSNLLPAVKIFEYRRNGHKIEHLLNINGNEIFRKEEYLEGCSIKSRTLWNQYNEIGNLINTIDGNGYLAQYQTGIERLEKKLDYVFDDTTLDEFLSFNLLYKEIKRNTKINPPFEYNPEIWYQIPKLTQKINDSDIITNYDYGKFQLIIKKSDKRYTFLNPTAEQIEREKSNSVYYKYIIDEHNHFVLSEIIYPDANWPIEIQNRSRVSNIKDLFIKYDSIGKILHKKIKSFDIFYSYYDVAQETSFRYLKSKTEPLINWPVFDGISEFQELFFKIPPLFEKTKTIVQKDNILDIIIEGNGIEFWTDAYNVSVVNNANVEINIDNTSIFWWNQQIDSIFKISGLSKGEHHIQLTASDNWSIGRIRTYATINYEIDPLGRIESEVNGRGVKKKYEYDQNDNIEKTYFNFDNYSMCKITEYDPNGSLIYKSTEWKDELGQLYGEASVVEINKYNKANRLIEKINTNGISSRNRLNKFVYNNNDQLIHKINGRGVMSSLYYDQLERINKISIASCSPFQSIEYFGYDSNDNVLSHIDANGHPKFNGHFDKTGEFFSDIDFLGRTVNQTDAKGNINNKSFDKNNNVLIERFFEFEEKDKKYYLIKRIANEYDELNELIKKSTYIFDEPILTRDPIYNPDVEFYNLVDQSKIETSEFYYCSDYQYSETVEINPLGGSTKYIKDFKNNTFLEIKYLHSTKIRLFDANGNRTKIYSVNYKVNDSNEIIKMQIFAQKYVYDNLNREIKSIDVNNCEWRKYYDSIGNLIKEVDPEDREKLYSYNCFGEIIETKEKQVDEFGRERWLKTLYEYDSNGNRTLIIDANKIKTKFDYDVLDRLISTTYNAENSNLKDNNFYDKVGNLIKYIDYNGLIRVNTYNCINQLICIEFDDFLLPQSQKLEPIASRKTDYKYNMKSELKFCENEICSIEFILDSRGIVLNEKYTIKVNGGLNREIKKRIDYGGNLERLVYPSGKNILFEYDSFNRLIKIIDDNNLPLAKYSYLGEKISSINYFNGFIQKLRYEMRGYLSDQIIIDSSNNILWREQKIRSNNKNVKLQNTKSLELTSSRFYQYDMLNQLINYSDQNINFYENVFTKYSFKELFKSSNADELNLYINEFYINDLKLYTYDDLGNRIESKDINGNNIVYKSNSLNQYEKVNDIDYKYDKNGNIIDEDRKIYKYDGKNLFICTYDGDDKQIEFYRDPLDRIILIKNFVDDTLKLWLFNNQDLIVEESDNGIHNHFHNNNIKSIISFINSDIHITICDIISSPRIVFRKDSIVNNFYYSPFGRQIIQQKQNYINPFTFGGMYYFPLLEKYLTIYRLFDTTIGRFIQRDPIGMNDRYNLYCYAKNNPQIYNDFIGLQHLDVDLNHKLDPEINYRMNCIYAEEKGIKYSDYWTSVATILDETIGLASLYYQSRMPNMVTKLFKSPILGTFTQKEYLFSMTRFLSIRGITTSLFAFGSIVFAGINMLGTYYQQEPETKTLGLALEGTGALGGLATTFITPIIMGTAGTALALNLSILLPLVGAGASGLSVGMSLNNILFFPLFESAYDYERLYLMTEAANDELRLGLPLSDISKKAIEESEKLKREREELKEKMQMICFSRSIC